MQIGSGKAVAAREDAGTVVHVKDETGVKMYSDADGTVPVTITVVGTYSSRYRRLTDAERDKLVAQRRTQIDGDVVEQQQLEKTASCILAWDGFTIGDGDEPFPCTKANAIALLTEARWIREQVEAAMNDHALFLR